MAKKRYDEKTPETGTYVLLDGKKPHQDGDRFVQPGETVELTAAQANAWSDKFKKVGSPPLPSKEDANPPVEVTARLPEKPQDAGGQAVDLKVNPNPLNEVAITPGKVVK